MQLASAEAKSLASLMRAALVRRFFGAVCLAAATAATAGAQCYLFTSSTSNASLQIQINSFLSQMGPINTTGGSYTYEYTFLGTYTLKVGSSTQVTTNQLGGLSYGYTTIGEDLTTMAWLVAEPNLKSTWQVTLQSSQELMPNGLPQTLPPISQWVGPAGMAPDQIGIPGPPATFYPITQITSCSASTGGGGSTPSTISISDTSLQFAYTEGASQTVNITNAGGGNLTWSAVPSSPWIVLTPTATTLTIAIDPSGLPAGPNIGVIVVTSPGATNSPQDIMVNLTITAPSPPVISSPMHFTPITPCRMVDTRNADGPFGGPAVAANGARSFAVPESACGIPSTAGAYSLNIAVVPAATLGYLTVWPTGQPQPEVATLTALGGHVRSNAAIVPAGTGGAISVFATDETAVIIDINGYFNVAGASADATSKRPQEHIAAASSTGGTAFYPVTPCRIADTRNAAGSFGGPSLAAGSTRAFPIPQSACGVPTDAQAYSLNFAAVTNTAVGYITAWPTGQAQPVVASLNDVTGTIVANAVIVPAGQNGAIDVYTTDKTDLVIDINGYFAPAGAGGLSLYAMTPCRVLDSRNPAGTPPFTSDLNVNVISSPCGVPATAQAFVFNATVVPPGLFGYLTMWPEGEPQPLAATLNAIDKAITSNLAIVPTKNGSITAYASNPTYLILDIFGFFAP
jgi:hypothetical protein